MTATGFAGWGPQAGESATSGSRREHGSATSRATVPGPSPGDGAAYSPETGSRLARTFQFVWLAFRHPILVADALLDAGSSEVSF